MIQIPKNPYRQTPAYHGLYRETKRLVDIANKRIARLEKSDVSKASYALKQIPEHTVLGEHGNIYFSKKYSIRNKSYNELVQLKAEVQKFLNYKTSTVTGTKFMIKKQSEMLALKPQLLDSYWSHYDKVMEAIEKRGEKRFINYRYVMQKVKEATIDENEKEEVFNVDKVLEDLTYEKASGHQEYTWNPEWFTE